jgi:hypothetical protein
MRTNTPRALCALQFPLHLIANVCDLIGDLFTLQLSSLDALVHLVRQVGP